MDLNEYQTAAVRTAGDTSLGVLALGLAGEAGEVADIVIDEQIGDGYELSQRIAKELGDVLWYTAALAYAHGFELASLLGSRKRDTAELLASNFRLTLKMCGHVGRLADHVKKHLGHGHDLDLKLIGDALSEILWHIMAIGMRFGQPLARISEINVEKLRVRYPDGFSEEASKARADVA